MCVERKFSARWCVARHGKFGLASVATQQIQHGENGQCLWAKQAKRKWGSVWAGTSLSLSLVARTFWHAFGLNLKGFFTHFVVVLSYLVVNFSYSIAVFSYLFVCKRHFLGYCAFVKFLNALFLSFLRLSLQAVFAKTAWQAINLALFLLFGLPRKAFALLAMTAHFVILSLLQKGDQAACKAQAAAKKSTKIKENLPFLDTSLALSMTSILRYFTLLRKVQYDKDFVILSLCKRRKIHTLKCKFALQIYGYFATISMTSILRLSPSLKFNTQSLRILCYNFILKDKNAKI